MQHTGSRYGPKLHLPLYSAVLVPRQRHSSFEETCACGRDDVQHTHAEKSGHCAVETLNVGGVQLRQCPITVRACTCCKVGWGELYSVAVCGHTSSRSIAVQTRLLLRVAARKLLHFSQN
eukprot:IDg10649t1